MAADNDVVAPWQDLHSAVLPTEGSICRRTRICQGLFERCAQTERLSLAEWLETQQGRFNLWAFVLKASETGKQSLDHRVRARPEITEAIEDLLDGLAETLEHCLEMVEGNEAPSDQEEALYQFEDVTSSRLSPWSDEEEDAEDGKATWREPFSQQRLYITFIVDQLRRISTAIRKSGVGYRYEKADKELREEDFQELRGFLVATLLVEELRQGRITSQELLQAVYERLQHPESLALVQNRLVRANILRQHRIVFIAAPERREAQLRLLEKQGQRQPLPEQGHAGPSASKPRDGDRKALAAPEFTPSLRQAAQPPKRSSGQDGQSQMQTATAIPTEVGFETVINRAKSTPSTAPPATRTGETHEYPRCPKPAVDGLAKGLIHCPYCAEFLPGDYANNTKRWNLHVAHDLLPYVCIFEDCSTPDEMYASTVELTRHIIKEHGTTYWVCDYCPDQSTDAILESPSDWQSHMRAEHPDRFIEPELLFLCSASRQTLIPPVACPLCHVSSDIPSWSLDAHIAEHLELFALLSLPSWGSAGGAESLSNVPASSDRSDFGKDREPDREPELFAPLSLHSWGSAGWAESLSNVLASSDRSDFGKDREPEGFTTLDLKSIPERLINDAIRTWQQGLSQQASEDNLDPFQPKLMVSVPPSATTSHSGSGGPSSRPSLPTESDPVLPPTRDAKIVTKQRKIAIVGSRSVGKSSLAVQFVDGHFVENYYPTIENRFSKKIRYKDQDFITEIIDTAGQDEYSILNSKHFIGIHGYIIIYSVGSLPSFKMARTIRDKIIYHLGVGENDVPIVIVGNKSDLMPEQRQVSPADGQALANELKCGFTEASVRYNENVAKAFELMIARIEGAPNGGEAASSSKCCVM